MAERVASALVKLWGEVVGVVVDGQNGRAPRFQYSPDFPGELWPIAPIKMPFSASRIFQFPELSQVSGYQDTFHQLPGLLADALPEKFGNQLLGAMLARQGRSIDDLTPVERLSYLGQRGMGALEFEPDVIIHSINGEDIIDIQELVEVARLVLTEHAGHKTALSDENLASIISVGTSAGGAKAKAIIAWNPETNEVRSGQHTVPEGFEHWIIKFDEFENEEHASSLDIGKIEYAYSIMAGEAGINMMPSRLFEAGGLSHFMTKRFDRGADTIDGKMHVQSFCALMHADRNPPGRYGYEDLFNAARKLRCGQNELNELFRRMVFNIVTRNQDDHTKNHSFMLNDQGKWSITPAYDLCFSYKPGNKFISNHQMSCNGRRDEFDYDDLVAAAEVADIKNPDRIIEEVKAAAKLWLPIADAVGIDIERSRYIYSTFRTFDGYESKPPPPLTAPSMNP